MCVCVCVCVCVCLCVKVKKSIFKVFFYNLKTNEKPMVNNYNYSINKIFNEIILKKLSRATRGYVTSLYIYIYITEALEIFTIFHVNTIFKSKIKTN